MNREQPTLPELRPFPNTANPVVDEWLEKAAADLETATRECSVVRNANYDGVCFHAQQAVEQLMKALLISREVMPPHTHALESLAALVAVQAPGWKFEPAPLRQLSLGAVQYRYPGKSATRREALEALTTGCSVWPGLIALFPVG